MIVEFSNTGKANTLNISQIEAIMDVALQDETEPLVFVSAIDRVFCAGADIDEFLDEEAYARQTRLMLDMAEMLYRRPGACVSIVDGYCGGGGLLFPCLSDLTIASGQAVFACPEVKFDMFPGVVYWALLRKIDRNAAFRMCLGGEKIDVRSARDMGIVDVIFKTFSQEGAIDFAESRLGFLQYYRETRQLIGAAHSHQIPELMHCNRNAGRTKEEIRRYLEGIRQRH